MTVTCPPFSEYAVVADDVELAALLSCQLSAHGKYFSVLEQPRLTRSDRESEAIRCCNALARSRANTIIYANIGDITESLLASHHRDQRIIRIGSPDDFLNRELPQRRFPGDPIVCNKKCLGIGLLHALRKGRSISFSDDASIESYIQPRDQHLVVCEEGFEFAQLVAANFAYSVGAGLQLIPQVDEDLSEAMLERLYNIDTERELSATQVLAAVRQQIREVVGHIEIPRDGSITFFTRSFPIGFAFQEVPSTHLEVYPNLGINMVNGIAAAQRNGPGTRTAALIDPQTTMSTEINSAMRNLAPRGIYVRKYEGPDADVSSVSQVLESFPYDFLLISTHCGDVPGYRWTYDFIDDEVSRNSRRTFLWSDASNLGQVMFMRAKNELNTPDSVKELVTAIMRGKVHFVSCQVNAC